MPVFTDPIVIDNPLFQPWIQGLPGWSLSSEFPDLYAAVLAESVTFKISTTEAGIILEESYIPHNNGVHFKGLREVLSMFLRRKNTNLIIGGENTQIFDNFHFYVGDTVKYGEVIYCRMKTDIPATEFKGNLFLTTQYAKKVTTPGSKEFLTFWFTSLNAVKVKMFYRAANGSVAETDYINYLSGIVGFYTFDASFSAIKTLFPTIPADDCLYYRVGYETYNVEYLIDRSNYLTLHQLVFMNAFGVAETLHIRGEVIRHIDPSFSEGKVNRISRKWNQKENETFEASSGKIFFRSEYDIWRDMFQSPDVYLYVNDVPRKIFVTEAKNSINKLPGLNGPLKFTFRFADEADTWEYMRFMEWILKDGTWDDSGVWLDSGEWIDEPV